MTVPTREQTTQIVRPGGPVPPGPPAFTRPGTPASGLTGRDILRILRKRKLMIILSVAICTVLAVVGTLLWSMFAPLYTAEGYLIVNAPRGSEFAPNVGLYGKEIMDRLAQTTAETVQRPDVLVLAVGASEESVPDDLEGHIRDVQQTSWFRKDKSRAAQRLEEEISIAPVAGTNLIRVSYTGRNPKEAPIIVNAMLEAAEYYYARAVQGDVTKDIRKLTEEREGIEDKRKAALQRARNVTPGSTATGRIGELQLQVAMYQVEMRAYQTEITKLELEKSREETAMKNIANMSDAELAQLPEMELAIANDPLIRNLRAALVNLEAERENAAARLAPEHLVVKNLGARIGSITTQLEQRSEELKATQARMLRSARESALAAVMQQLAQVRAEYQEAERKATDAAKQLETEEASLEAAKLEQERQVRDAEVEAQSLARRVDRIDARLDDLRVKARGMETLQVRSSAAEPEEPSWPKWTVLVPLGVVVGLVIGLGLAVTLELVDTSIKSPSDVSRRIELPLLGMVPHTEDVEDQIEDIRRAFITSPRSLIGEAYRQIRTCLLFSGPAAQRRSLLIASPLPGDGRTSVALNLGASVARGGRRVLVVDANFRQPAVSRLFPQAPKDGLSSALVGQADWREQVYAVEENLSVMPAGPLPPNPAELLGSDQMRVLIEEMQGQYDQVLFDGAPCMVLTDSPVLGTQVDGVILVVRAGANTYGIVQRARSMFDRVGAHIVGVVLNGVRVTAGGYLRKNYETYYEYHQQPQLPSA